MAESVEFQLKLQDQMTAALTGAATSALKLESALDKLTAKLQSLEKEEKQEKSEEEGMFAKAVEKGELMKDLVEKIAEKVYELGRELIESTIEITDFGYRAEVALRHLNGETEGAQGRTNTMLKEARQFAYDAAEPVDKVVDAFLGLKRAQLPDEWIRPLVAAAGDLAALSGHPENFQQLVDVFENIALKGEITGRSLLSLTQAGVSPAALAAKFGAKDFRELQEQLSKHPVGALEGLRAIEEVIKATAHEDVLGDTWKETTNTFADTIQRVKNDFRTFVDSLNQDPAFKTLRDDFQGLEQHLHDNLPKLEIMFQNMIDPILKAVDRLITNPDVLSNVFSRALNDIELVASAIEKIAALVEWITGNAPVFKAIAGASAGAAVAGPWGALAVGGTAGYAAARQEEHEKLTGAGYSERDTNRYLGKFADGGPIDDEGMAHVHAGEYVVPSGGALVSKGGGRHVDAPITINVHVEGGSGMTEHGLSIQLKELLPGVLVPAREQLASTIGAA